MFTGKYRRLGSSGLLVSPICLGTMTFGTPVVEREAIKLVHGAMDLGINFVDTANVYEGYRRSLGSAGGVAEEILGKALQGRRDKVVLATKVGSPLGAGPQDAGLTSSHIHRELDNSLRRLQTDYIDLYIIHWPDNWTPLETTLAAMEQVVKQGKVRYFGVSNHPAWQICELLWQADKCGWPCVVSSQIPFSLLRREYQNDLDFCAKHDIATTPYQVLQGGLLTGKYHRNAPAAVDSRAAEQPSWIWPLSDALFDKLEALEHIAHERKLSLAQLTMAWTLAQPSMASLIIGVKSLAQVRDAVAAAEVTIGAEDCAKLDEICPPPWNNATPFDRC